MSFLPSTGPLGKIQRRADLDAAELDRLLGRFQDGAPEMRALKRDRKTSVYSGLVLGGRQLCVKVYRDARRGRRGFRNLCDLFREGVPVPEPFFLWERSRTAGGGVAVGMEDLAPRPELDRWLAARLESQKTLEARRAALWPVFRRLGAGIRDLHARGVYLDDLKTCNIFIEDPERPRFRFVDLDGACEGRPVSLHRRAKNLAQLNRSTPVLAGVGCRRAFWREYRIGLAPRVARRLRQAVLKQSGARPVVYVSPAGVEEEPWPAGAWDWPR